MSIFKVTIRFGSLITKINKAYSITTSGNKPDDDTVIHSLSPSIITKGNPMQVICNYVNDGEDHAYYEIVILNKYIEFLCAYAPQK